jgi:two-component system sensor kinase
MIELRRSEQIFEDILQGITDPVLLLSKDFKVLWANKAFQVQTGYKIEEIVGNYCYRLTHRQEAPCKSPYDLCPVSEAEKIGSTATTIHIHFDKKGEQTFVEISAYPVKDEKGEIINFVYTYRDITERKRMEKSLQDTAHSLGERVKELNCLYGISNLASRKDITLEEILQGVINLIPPAWQYPDITCARIVLEGREFRTKNFQETAWRQTSAIIVHNKRAGMVEVCYLKTRPASDEGTFLKEERTLIDAIAEHVGRITERKQAEEEIQELNSELKQKVMELTEANKELDAFNHTVSHDLKLPLIIIGGFARRFLKGHGNTLDTKDKDMLNTIQEHIQKMERLINDLLAFSRVGRRKIKLTEIDIGNLVTTVLEELKPLTEGRSIKYDIKNLPKSHSDIALLKQVFINLLSNAIKFTSKKKMAVIEVGGWTEENKNVYYVKDNGMGFNSQDSGKLFTFFQRLHGIEELEGSGIGLSIVQRIVKRHGGQVWAEGKVNEGATFYFSLPNKISGDS